MNRNITATILIVIAGAIYFTYTSGVWLEAKDVKAVNDQYTSALANAEKLIALRDKANKDYNSITPDNQEKLNKMLPNTVDNIRLIIDLNNIGTQNGLSLKNINASTKSSGSSASNGQGSGTFGQKNASNINIPTLDTVGVSFSVTATYQQFITLMQALEANLRLMDLTHLSISVSDTGTYNFSVQLNTYYLRQ
ncbi:MAG: hypothetical protein PHG25_01635 [Candidatus Pacebacteria bacterium]|nr:hypothetical protein [Candidatus Paceibacterota bacterium]